ncbi:DUF4402 domain-containing protein [Sphingorhabdus sp. Alg239-R122]|uniref:DUF4402 domain-containing protein n=1 Tax=Sphingorhabdus sp. Alg239-R122 TaxID=2305989 RepID=UPI0013DC6DC2|nr:DUF4402 domain-containing protein [Sphingorhabdus sp. Alg239-R122]
MLLCLAALTVQPAPNALAQCRLCSDSEKAKESKEKKPSKALHINITTALDFDRLALTGQSGGEVELDPYNGQRNFRGEVEGLGGMWLSGEAVITGEPGRGIRITLPAQVTLRAPGGGKAELMSMETTLPAAPQLDATGRLTFAFGGRLRVDGNASGHYRGRIRITANYE